MANIFESLKSRFINSMASLVEKTPRSVVNIGISTGLASQSFNFPEKSITIDSETIFVGATIWSRVDSFASSSASDLHYTLTYSSSSMDMTTSRPVLTFGNGTNGAIPTSGSQITADFESCRLKLSNREMFCLFESSIVPVQIGFGVSITVNSIDYSSEEFDISYDASDAVEDMILYHARMLAEIKMLDADKAIYYKSQAVVIDGKQVAKSQTENLKTITEWYNKIVRDYRKSKQIARFILRTSIFEDTTNA